MELNIDDIINFWFADIDENGQVPKTTSQQWWQKSDSFDNLLKEKFGPSVMLAVLGKLNHWCDTARGSLAYIILLDQFSRNIHRDTPEAFANDNLALTAALKAIASQQDNELLPIQKVFLYMPLEHSEDISLQNQCVALFQKLLDNSVKEQQATFQGFLEFAKSHHSVIKQFGRFPHRNKILNRTSTPAEEEYLQQPGAGF